MGALYALLAAALFGASAPLAKVLVGQAPPLVLSGLLYLGAGVAALGLGLFQRPRPRFERGDGRWLAGVIAAGGVAGPACLLVGLERTPGSTASLLLNLEAVFTTLLALGFGERIGRRGVLALALVTAGAAWLSLAPDAGQAAPGVRASWLGPLAIALACAAWGLDNNLTQRLSARDPLLVVRYKGLCAGAVSLGLGLAVGGRLPPGGALVAALALGALGYGLSLALYVRALRSLGAARTGMLFATAPFAGALLAIPLLGEHPGLSLLGAATLLAAGTALLVTAPSSAA